MAREDLALERLRDALSALAADDASALVQEASAQARERVLALLAENRALEERIARLETALAARG